ncbi:hypothetical protein ABZ756_13645 [Mammaliicoccus sciuri]
MEYLENLAPPNTFKDPEDTVPDFNYELMMENARLRKILEMYAKEENYNKKNYYSGIRKVPILEVDRGRAARKALGWKEGRLK